MRFLTGTDLLILSAVVSSAVLAQTPQIPTQDPFYSQPSNISSYQPGQVIDSRSIPNGLSGFFTSNLTLNVHKAYQFLYRTTDSLDNPIAAVTTLLVPYNADPSKLLAYSTAYDSSNPNCSPSYSLRRGANTTSADDIVFISAGLDKGWYVVTSDYEGLNAQYVAGVQTGRGVLDSVRAAFNTASMTGLSSDATYAMWGYSGGALASEWAAEEQPSYAPELKFAGAAMGGLTPNVTSVLLTINQGPFSGLAFAGITGLAKAFPNLTEFVDAHLIPSKKEQFYNIASGCISQLETDGGFQDLYSYFYNSSTLISQAVPQSILNTAGQMGLRGTPTMPMFVYKAIGDEISPVADTDALVSKLCSQGANIQYQKNLVGEHVSEAISGSGSAFSWVQDRLNGVPITQDGCRTDYVAFSALSPEAFEGFGNEAIPLLQDIFGGKLGLAASG